MDHEAHDMDNMETAAKQGKEYTSKYVCPMHSSFRVCDRYASFPKNIIVPVRPFESPRSARRSFHKPGIYPLRRFHYLRSALDKHI